jgi:group I intron endonuclease
MALVLGTRYREFESRRSDQMFYIYIIQNLINLKVYIGKTNNPSRRFTNHKKIAEVGMSVGRKTFNLLHKAIVKYGIKNFSSQVWEEFDNEEDCLEAEKFWIEFFRSNVNRFGSECGYNLTAGGDGITGKRHTKISKEKISAALQGRKIYNRKRRNDTDIAKSVLRLQNHYDGTNQYTGKIPWPEDRLFLKMIEESSQGKVAKKFGVTQQAVNARLKKIKKNILA